MRKIIISGDKNIDSMIIKNEFHALTIDKEGNFSHFSRKLNDNEIELNQEIKECEKELENKRKELSSSILKEAL